MKLYCYDCTNFIKIAPFCGYSECRCKVYGSLDIDQTERHPDRTANTCPDYDECTDEEAQSNGNK